MPYRFATTRQDYSDYARGRVFYGLRGHPAFPVRLTSEIWQRCVARLRAAGRPGPYAVYDPCCGGAYLLATLGYLHSLDLAAISGSDVDATVLETAARNLALLHEEGMQRRIAELRRLAEAYGRSSHVAAIESAERLKGRLFGSGRHEIETHLFRADATNARALVEGLGGREVDVVIADVPYGRDSTWQRPGEGGVPSSGLVVQLLDALCAVASGDTLVALAADKGQVLLHPAYRRVERFRLGKRQVALLRPLAPKTLSGE
jgi:tRNA G10  N-methylase Trm11